MSLLPWFTAYLSHTSSDPFTSQPLLHQNTKNSLQNTQWAFVQWFKCDCSICFAKTMPHSSNSSNFIQLSLFCIRKKCKVWNANLQVARGFVLAEWEYCQKNKASYWYKFKSPIYLSSDKFTNAVFIIFNTALWYVCVHCLQCSISYNLVLWILSSAWDLKNCNVCVSMSHAVCVVWFKRKNTTYSMYWETVELTSVRY